MGKNSKTAHLRDKTDAECRELMIHYYLRARRAEDAEHRSAQKVVRLEAEVRQIGHMVGSAKALADEIRGL